MPREKIISAIIADMIMLRGENRLRNIKHNFIGWNNAERSGTTKNTAKIHMKCIPFY